MTALLFEKSGLIVTLTINRPDSRNPLGEEGDGELFADAASRINADRDIRCVILTGAGKAFSAGGNLKAMREKSGTFAGPGVLIRERYRSNIHRMVRALWSIEVPMICAVNGPAMDQSWGRVTPTQAESSKPGFSAPVASDCRKRQPLVNC